MDYPIEGGSGKIKIEPQPGSLEKVDFDVYTAKGAVHFIRRKERETDPSVEDPDTVSVELWLDAREEIKLPFLRTEKMESKYIDGRSGKNTNFI